MTQTPRPVRAQLWTAACRIGRQLSLPWMSLAFALIVLSTRFEGRASVIFAGVAVVLLLLNLINAARRADLATRS